METSAEIKPPAFREAVAFWLKLGLISFGGPAAQIAAMHRELVEAKRWMDERHFLNGLNFCMLLPGPEAQQLATYLGWRLHGAKGGLAASMESVGPSAGSAGGAGDFGIFKGTRYRLAFPGASPV